MIMKNLFDYITEGGASGHMKHPYDYTNFTLRDIKGLIRNLFSGRIEDITEKIDGTNIQAMMNTAGEVVFIRNKGDLNSAKGGMTIDDMSKKWADKPNISKTFLTAGQLITEVFKKIGPDFFNPSADKRLVCNCECVIEGKTNVLYYGSSQVDFHDIWVYEFINNQWQNTDVTKKGLDVIQKACENVDGAKITPKVIIKTTEKTNEILTTYIKEIDKLFKTEKLGEYNIIEEWKKVRFENYLKENNLKWLYDDYYGTNALFERWFNGDKSINIKKIKELYEGHEDEIAELDKKGYKQIVGDVMRPLDNFFTRLGNDLIELCDGIINANNKDAVVKQLTNDLKNAVDTIRTEGSDDANQKLTIQLNRLKDMQLNAAEGIVFRYKGNLMKCTGSFAALNQVLGLQYR